jgi:propanol-preferring alcohol dehydrogenase
MSRRLGERVVIAWPGYACGQCRYCIARWETLCEKQQNSGYSVNGTFAEYAHRARELRYARARWRGDS